MFHFELDFFHTIFKFLCTIKLAKIESYQIIINFKTIFVLTGIFLHRNYKIVSHKAVIDSVIDKFCFQRF